jgi:uncharacterized protein YbbK (DUF523 family)
VRLRLGISSCLLGEPVRYNGAHKLAPWLDELAPDVEWVSVCPEVEAGMGVPREPVRLERAGGGSRMIGNSSAVDYTSRMHAWAARRLDALTARGISGYVLKKDSPSCGAEGVPLHDDGIPVNREGRGLFAAALLARLPDLPVTEEDRLMDAAGRDAFLSKCRAYARRHG